MNRINISKRQIFFISFYLLIFVIGTALIFIIPTKVKITYGHTVKTSDGETISFDVVEPKREGLNKKAVIIGHGIMSNKEMLMGYAIELACAGFVAVPFDFRGHGQSTGIIDYDKLINDVKAIESYLKSRSDINSSSLGYVGFSMGGFPGIEIVNESTNFKCFVGAATRLPEKVRKGNSSAHLNILMIIGRYDEVFSLSELKEGLSDRVGLPISEIEVNKLYGSFQEGNASMIYLDDNSNHVLGNWDPDFIRETRNFVKNTFPDVRPVDENFYANTRLYILIMQLFGGFGFFMVIIKPLYKSVLKSNEEDFFRIESEDVTIKSLSIKIIGYSLVLGIPGIFIFAPILLFLPLATAGFILLLYFGQTFGFLILLWRFGKGRELRLIEILKQPFKASRKHLLKQFILGTFLAILLFMIIYLSAGLNYMGMIPSLIKLPWVPLYFVITFIIFMIFGILFQGIIQNKFEKGIKNFLKISLFIFGNLLLYMFIYLFIIAIVTGSFFYFGSFMPFALPLFLLNSFISTHFYRNSGNIIGGSIINTLFFTLLICTISPYQIGLNFIMGFFH